MAKRDLERTARNKRIEKITAKLRCLLPDTLKITGVSTELSLNGIYGGKHAQFIDIKNAVIQTPEHFVALWLRGYMAFLRKFAVAKGRFAEDSSYYKHFKLMQRNPKLWEWVELFLKRTFLRNYDSLMRTRPSVEESTIWIGENKASYGLLVTPRFARGNWENDKSEIRHFPKDYWTIGHVLETGLVIPFKGERVQFVTPSEYLTFFKHVLVRGTGSQYQNEIAQRYAQFAEDAPNPEKVPLLVPELRYAGISALHQYRLDFCVIDPFTMDRVGFELSPWSTHGSLTGVKKMTQKQINELAKQNFEAEMKKLKAYFKEHGIYTLVYTDSDLADPDTVFEDISRFLVPQRAAQQLQLTVRDEFLSFKL